MAVRVRFAPSPTGNLHLGGFRTALINYLFAKKHNGSFILRVEDTDQTRCVPGAASKLEDDLEWLNISPDESPRRGGNYGPYIQSQRLNFYHEFIKRLIDNGSAYECFCSEQRLNLLRKEAVRIRAIPGYDNKCRGLTRDQVVQRKTLGEKHVIRFKLSLQPTEFQDVLGGQVTVLDKHDPVLLKSDGFPTYHFANVVDDHLMAISHVFRGNEWQVSTGLHMQMYRAFGWTPPLFAHLPVLLNKDGKKLSKRQAHVSIDHYRSENCAPISLTNFVTKSGGGFYHGVDRILTMEELIEQFDVGKLNNNSCRLDFDLLEELNKVHFRERLERNSEELMHRLKKLHPNASEEFLQRVITWAKSRITSVQGFEEMSFLWAAPQVEGLSHATETFKSLLDGNLENLNDFVDNHGLNKKLFYRDLRLILTGTEVGTPIKELLELLGEDIVRERIANVVSRIDNEQHGHKRNQSR